MKNSTSRQSGLSLVEILVALVISLFLLGGIIQVYIGNKANYNFSDASSRLQENGRFALDKITTDVRLAGFFGCISLDTASDLIQNHLNKASANYNPDIHDFINSAPIQITGHTGLDGLSDELTIRGSKPGQATVSTTLNKPGSAPIQVKGSTPFKSHDIVLITNCWTSDIFEANSASTSNTGVTTLTHTTAVPDHTPGNMDLNGCGANCLIDVNSEDSNLESAYMENNSSVYSLQTVTYSIKPATSDKTIPALWREENGNDQELIEGIEQMIVLYGVDNSVANPGEVKTPNQYFDSNEPAVNLSAVTAIRVFLVARSERDFVLEDNQHYTVNGVEKTAPDLRRRQVFSVTIDLRNR